MCVQASHSVCVQGGGGSCPVVEREREAECICCTVERRGQSR